ncbi:hypothetical protein LAZ67_1007475 [Cordylochernes scorpioides]|uniref:Uncharacterized protein n=1 Tax=Cordylochernes scorpioides TaxID=51811 RepID=A0ABY6JZ94_9ARAC|nr:hypothetical protein LAZ67_1007475 [Cordylochernes scorpioides]
MITPVFHFRVFEGYQDIVNSHTGLLVDHLRVQGSGWLDINPVMSRCLLDAIGGDNSLPRVKYRIIYAAAAFGIEMNALNGDSEYLAHLKK